MGGRSRQISMNFWQAWSTEQVPRHPELHREMLYTKTNKQTKTKHHKKKPRKQQQLYCMMMFQRAEWLPGLFGALSLFLVLQGQYITKYISLPYCFIFPIPLLTQIIQHPSQPSDHLQAAMTPGTLCPFESQTFLFTSLLGSWNDCIL